MRVLSVALLLATLLRGAGFDGTRWKYFEPLRVLEPRRLCVLPFDRGLYSRLRPDLGDLRIEQDGEEIPYAIEAMTGAVEERECHPAMINKAVVPDTGVQITLDLAKCQDELKHSRLRIATNETNFRQRVRVETSDDNRFWVIAREDGYIFDFTEGGKKLSALTVDYPVSTGRYVRATIFGWTTTGAIADAWSIYREERSPERYILAGIVPERSEDPATRTSLLKLDLSQPGLPHDRVRVDVDRTDFHRAAELEVSEDAKTWRTVAQGAIFRVGEEQSLALGFRERYERYLRLRIFNGDNRPVAVTRVFVETVKRVMKFLPPSDGDARLYFGNPDAAAPVYDFAAILSRQAPLPETTPTVGEWKLNPDYRSPGEAGKPWSERHPALLYGVLGLAVVGMGLVTVRFLMKVKGS
jgi:Protein of unknown function (DUF3999)